MGLMSVAFYDRLLFSFYAAKYIHIRITNLIKLYIISSFIQLSKNVAFKSELQQSIVIKVKV